MHSNRILSVTLVLSVLAHGVIFLKYPIFNPFIQTQKEQKIEVNYIKEPIKTVLLSKLEKQNTLPKQEPFLKLDSKVITGSRVPPPYIEKENFFKDVKDLSAKSPEFSKPTFSSPDLLLLKKKITLPSIEMAKIDNPSYISYYQTVREKIRRCAYQNYNRNETGEVYISFIISNDGHIKSVRLIEEKTTGNDYLKDTALKSVKDASPFPNFPKELDYPQLSFNIIISFEIE